MTLVDRTSSVARTFVRWLGERPPKAILVAGWIVFALGCYPGYMSFESTMQLFDVRNGVYRDSHPPLISGVWSLLEFVVSGPFPMLALQSGLFLFGLAALLRTMLAPRAAAVTAVGALLFPPVFSVMAVIWREPLMTGALLAATGCFLEQQWRWRVVGALLLVLACACHMAAIVAIVPIAVLAVPTMAAWRRAGLAVAITLAVAGIAGVTNHALTDVETYEPRQALMVTDVFGTLRRAHVTDEKRAARLLTGLPITSPAKLRATLAIRSAAIDWWPFSHGNNAALDPLSNDNQDAALGDAWRRTIRAYPGSYLKHRWIFAKHMLALTGKSLSVYDSFGEPDLIGTLHHRASTSDWEVGMQAIVHVVERTPLFWPWCYLLLAIVGLVLARGRPILRLLLASGLAFELAMMFVAPATDFRYSHWLVTVTSLAFAVLAVSRRAAWRR